MRMWQAVRTVPVTAAYSAVVLVTAGAESLLGEQRSDAVARALSTDLVHLQQMPLRVLAGSAFVLERPGHALLALPVLAVAMGAVERWRGGRTAAATFAAGHVGATLLVAAGMAAGITLGRLDPGYRSMVDVGLSYGQWSLLGLLAARVPAQWRSGYALGLSCLLGSTAAAGHEPVDAGHVLAWGIGLSLAAAMLRRERTRQAVEALAATT